ncbi:membrane protein [Paenibacillus mucilaginosus K02]|uniref:Membrane protein n=1 Tax=Paenibacillus mucilaginosus K02 TaxID=997761 RepID=I0BBC7_9BACL|nr:EamA family transporter [Paenibacillus mucilaginosus]AFH59674.1 membrane protein [Paenibacillus mucilaginosus K02]
MKSAILILLNIILLVTGQAVWKIGVTKTPLGGTRNLLELILSPWIIGGGVLYAVATGIWLYLLSRFPLSFLYPMQSLAYVLGIVISVLIFKEVVPLTRWVGVGVVMVGIYLISKQ